MSIEQRLQAYIDSQQLDTSEDIIDRSSIKNWRWFGVPASLQSLRDLDYLKIDTMISSAGTIECLSSQSEYIRGMKRWQLEMAKKTIRP